MRRERRKRRKRGMLSEKRERRRKRRKRGMLSEKRERRNRRKRGMLSLSPVSTNLLWVPPCQFLCERLNAATGDGGTLCTLCGSQLKLHSRAIP